MVNITRSTPSTPTLSGGWEPFRVMRELLRMDPFRELGTLQPMENVDFAPNFDVKETKESFVLKADLPGIKEQDLNVSLTGNRLSISGKREAEERKQDESYYAVERSYGSFMRSFTLPEGILADKVQADLKDGVLTLQLPKVPEAKAKKIDVKVK